MRVLHSRLHVTGVHTCRLRHCLVLARRYCLTFAFDDAEDRREKNRGGDYARVTPFLNSSFEAPLTSLTGEPGTSLQMQIDIQTRGVRHIVIIRVTAHSYLISSLILRLINLMLYESNKI